MTYFIFFPERAPGIQRMWDRRIYPTVPPVPGVRRTISPRQCNPLFLCFSSVPIATTPWLSVAVRARTVQCA